MTEPPAPDPSATEPPARDPLAVVLPAGIDDPAAPSGGNRYDRRVCDGLATRHDLHEIAVAGAWPQPAPAHRGALRRALAGLPDGMPVLLDGLVAGGVPEVLEAEASRLRLITLVHLPLGDETGLEAATATRLHRLEGRALHACAAVVTTSAAAAERVTGLHGLPATRVHVAPPGSDRAAAAVPSPRGARLLCVAAVTHRKGQDVLVDALSTMDDLDWVCRCVGATDREPAFAAALRGRHPRVTFAGTRAGAELDRTYAEADLLVLPSRAETYGMVVTEALARGVPVLGSDVTGVREALGDGGGLVPPGDPGALAAALRRWLTDEGLRTAWRGAAARRRAALPGWDATVRALDDVISPPPTPPPAAEEEHHGR
ncbi:glycosyltransferase family 4 protein [Mangrovihabitans endophyticus]|uniref:Glycosyl transferase n=1 Tax=Mangrovihabitans endophyticus TaxID=1751298 RepID=A0A8J3FR05_9ACTN|nr:glycosyltransferase family 4 protein [Mangrovihabitans endophyticus]GGL07778.1 glycosyl transferase [Mangrovihabitans endophyticus]